MFKKRNMLSQRKIVKNEWRHNSFYEKLSKKYGSTVDATLGRLTLFYKKNVFENDVIPSTINETIIHQHFYSIDHHYFHKWINNQSFQLAKTLAQSPIIKRIGSKNLYHLLNKQEHFLSFHLAGNNNVDLQSIRVNKSSNKLLNNQSIKKIQNVKQLVTQSSINEARNYELNHLIELKANNDSLLNKISISYLKHNIYPLLNNIRSTNITKLGFLTSKERLNTFEPLSLKRNESIHNINQLQQLNHFIKQLLNNRTILVNEINAPIVNKMIQSWSIQKNHHVLHHVKKTNEITLEDNNLIDNQQFISLREKVSIFINNFIHQSLKSIHRASYLLTKKMSTNHLTHKLINLPLPFEHPAFSKTTLKQLLIRYLNKIKRAHKYNFANLSFINKSHHLYQLNDRNERLKRINRLSIIERQRIHDANEMILQTHPLTNHRFIAQLYPVKLSHAEKVKEAKLVELIKNITSRIFMKRIRSVIHNLQESDLTKWLYNKKYVLNVRHTRGVSKVLKSEQYNKNHIYQAFVNSNESIHYDSISDHINNESNIINFVNKMLNDVQKRTANLVNINENNIIKGVERNMFNRMVLLHKSLTLTANNSYFSNEMKVSLLNETLHNNKIIETKNLHLNNKSGNENLIQHFNQSIPLSQYVQRIKHIRSHMMRLDQKIMGNKRLQKQLDKIVIPKIDTVSFNNVMQIISLLKNHVDIENNSRGMRHALPLVLNKIRKLKQIHHFVAKLQQSDKRILKHTQAKTISSELFHSTKRTSFVHNKFQAIEDKQIYKRKKEQIALTRLVEQQITKRIQEIVPVVQSVNTRKTYRDRHHVFHKRNKDLLEQLKQQVTLVRAINKEILTRNEEAITHNQTFRSSFFTHLARKNSKTMTSSYSFYLNNNESDLENIVQRIEHMKRLTKNFRKRTNMSVVSIQSLHSIFNSARKITSIMENEKKRLAQLTLRKENNSFLANHRLLTTTLEHKKSNNVIYEMQREAAVRPVSIDYYQEKKRESKPVIQAKRVSKQFVSTVKEQHRDKESISISYFEKNFSQIVDKVYRAIERKVQLERKRRGL